MSDLDKLKDLLFGAEKEALDSITERVESPEMRSSDVAAILPEAIHRSHLDGRELRESLTAPVGECLREAFREDPQTYGDALYPVMGPAIRKSILHTLRTFAQQINEAVEQSLTPRGLAWRVQAWRAGIPFGQFVLQKTLLYRVEQAYLISRENGLLVGHAQHEAARIKDSDAVSAMFTAIQDFVKESFSPDRSGRLESADMGEFTLWAIHGPHALLVCVIRGVPPRALRNDLSAILERIHFRYGEAIRTYSGDTATVPDVEEELAACLRLEARQAADAKRKRLSLPLLIILALLAVAVTWLLVTGWMQSQKLDRLTTALEDTPGIYVAGSDATRSQLMIRGMRDPIAPTVAEVAESIGISGDIVVADMSAFHSLEPTLVAQRAAQRFEAPDDVRFEMAGTVLVVSGPALIEWQQRVRNGINTVAGVTSVEFRLDADDRAQVTRDFLEAPDGVEFVARDGGVVLLGDVPVQWIDESAARISAAGIPWPVDFTVLNTGALSNALREMAELDGKTFFFGSGTTLVEESVATLDDYAAELRELAESLNALGLGLRITATGSVDLTGSERINAALAPRRAATITSALESAGVPADFEQRAVERPEGGEPMVDYELRRVTVELESFELPSAQ